MPPLAAVLGWPATRIGGVAGRLARANSKRNPTRTASTASALMIGLALVTFVSVLAAGLKSTFETAVNETFKADYVLTATNNFSPISTARGSAAAGARRASRSPACAPARAGRSAEIVVTGVGPEISRSIRSIGRRARRRCRASWQRRRLRLQGIRRRTPPACRLAHQCRDAAGDAWTYGCMASSRRRKAARRTAT